MARVTVEPTAFHFVSYEAATIESLVAQVADDAGLGDEAITVEVDESTPLGRARLASLDPIVLQIEGGAFEDPTNPRSLSERLVRDVTGRLLLRAADRRRADFAGVPAEGELSLAQLTAWDAYCMGRLERLGYDVRKPRRLYHFRNRHGFHDVADAEFERLWAADDLGWDDLVAACDRTAAVGAT